MFSSTPGHGHLLPQLPLARAFAARGHEVAVLTADGMAPVIIPEGFEHLVAGPMPDVLFEESERRSGVNVAYHPTPEAAAEFFAGTRVDLTADEAVVAARQWRPDLVVSEACDFVGPLVAAALEVPVARFGFGPALPAQHVAAMDGVAFTRYEERGLVPRPPAWYLDTCPPLLQFEDWPRPQGWLNLRPEPHQHPWAADRATGPTIPKTSRPLVLLTFGTLFSSPELLNPLLRELSTLDVELLVTLGLTAAAADFEAHGERVHFTPFVPLHELLHGVDVVVFHGGAGTTFGALARKIPLVVLPQGADQFLQADRVVAAGAGVALPPGTSPEQVADAVRTVLVDQGIRDAATRIGDEIAAMPAPDDVAATLESAFAAAKTP